MRRAGPRDSRRPRPRVRRRAAGAHRDPVRALRARRHRAHGGAHLPRLHRCREAAAVARGRRADRPRRDHPGCAASSLQDASAQGAPRDADAAEPHGVGDARRAAQAHRQRDSRPWSCAARGRHVRAAPPRRAPPRRVARSRARLLRHELLEGRHACAAYGVRRCPNGDARFPRRTLHAGDRLARAPSHDRDRGAVDRDGDRPEDHRRAAARSAREADAAARDPGAASHRRVTPCAAPLARAPAALGPRVAVRRRPPSARASRERAWCWYSCA